MCIRRKSGFGVFPVTVILMLPPIIRSRHMLCLEGFFKTIKPVKLKHPNVTQPCGVV